MPTILQFSRGNATANLSKLQLNINILMHFDIFQEISGMVKAEKIHFALTDL